VIYSITPGTLSTGCADGPTVDVEIKVNAEPIQDLIITNNLSCYGQREGSLDLVLAEGSGPFEIYWTGTEGYTNEGEEDIDSLISGIYWVEVYDSLGCQSNDHITISSPGQLKGNLVGIPKDLFGMDTTWHISCAGGSDGEIGFEVLENNYPPFNYWLFGPDEDTIDAGNANNYDIFYFDSLPEGVYEMVLRDDEGCYESWTDTLFAPDPVEAQMHSPTYTDPYNLSCRGYSDGSIVIDIVANGNGIYQDYLYHYNYLWSDENGLLGVGGFVFDDRNGMVSRTGFQLTYAYHIWMDETQLSFGLSGTAFQFRINDEKLTFFDQSEPLLSGDLRKALFVPDANFGVYLLNSSYHVGFSVDQLFQSYLKIGNAGLSDYRMLRHYYLSGGYVFPLQNEFFLEPSILIKTTEELLYQIDFNAKLQYKADYWVGLSYRTAGAVILFAGIKLDKFYFGYAFDYTLSSIMKHSLGSHEFMMAVKFGDSARRFRWLDRY